MKILLISDSPYATTGLGRSTDGFLRMFPEHEWFIFAINHPTYLINGRSSKPVYDKSKYKAKFEMITQTQLTSNREDYSGVLEYIKQVKPDYIISVIDQDRIHSISAELKQLQMLVPFKWVMYYPFDRKYQAPEESVYYKSPDVLVAYSKYAQKKVEGMLGKKTKVYQIYLPLDVNEFPEIPEEELQEFKKQYFLKSDYLIGTVNRSFRRKDPARLIWSFAEYLKKHEKASLYFHGSQVTFEGSDLILLSYLMGIPQGHVMFTPKNYNEVSGVSSDALNKIYRSFDLFVSVSRGEGFGYTTVEAMLTGRPIIAPNNTTFPELIQNFGYLVPCEEDAFEYGGYDVPWPIVDTKALVGQMRYVKKNREEAEEKAKGGIKWVKENLNFDTIKKQWQEILR